MQAQLEKTLTYKPLLGRAIIGLSAMGLSAVVIYGGFVRLSLASADAINYKSMAHEVTGDRYETSSPAGAGRQEYTTYICWSSLHL